MGKCGPAGGLGYASRSARGPHLLGKPLSRLQLAILERPRSILAGGLLLTVLALWLGSGVEFRSSRSELAGASDPDQIRWDALLRDYQARETVIGCVEVGTSEASEEHLERFVDRLAEEVKNKKFKELSIIV